MKTNDGKELKQKEGVMKSSLLLSQHWRVSLAVALISISSIALFAFLGYNLDLVLDTSPAFVVVGLIISFPFSQFAVYKWIKGKYMPRMKKLS